MSQEFEGWANFETYAMAVYMINERGILEYWIDRAPQVAEDYELAEEMKQTITADTPELEEPWDSMMEAGLDEVVWREIAEEFRTKAEEQA